MTAASDDEVAEFYNRAARAEFALLRAQSLNIPCTYCSALVGEVCINRLNQGQLEHLPAHFTRLNVDNF